MYMVTAPARAHLLLRLLTYIYIYMIYMKFDIHSTVFLRVFSKSLNIDTLRTRQWFEQMHENGTPADYETFLMLMRSARDK